MFVTCISFLGKSAYVFAVRKDKAASFNHESPLSNLLNLELCLKLPRIDLSRQIPFDWHMKGLDIHY